MTSTERFMLVRRLYQDELHLEYERGLDMYGGKMLRPRATGPFASYIPMSYSTMLVDLTGGLVMLALTWEVEDDG